MRTYISSAYLCAKTSKKACIEASLEFCSQTGHLIIIANVFYGLHLSGKGFNQLLMDILCSLRFELSKVEPSTFTPTSCTIYYPANLLLALYISEIKSLWTGTKRNKAHQRLLYTDLNLSPTVLALNNPLIIATIFDILVSQSITLALPGVIMMQWSTVQNSQTYDSTNVTIFSHSVLSTTS